jgi:alkylation response protein AidB-like acyl-CoA dehydrogenase
MSEPGAAGSDPSLIETEATRTGADRWRITGEKWFVTDAAVATHVLAFVKTGDGLTAFLVPTDAKGFDVLREIPVMGEDPSGVYHVRLDGIELSDDHVVGGVGNGARVAQARLVPGRILHCSRWIGQAQRAFALMCERANDRKAHGGVLADKGQIQDLVAHTAADIYSARLMVHDVAARYERGDDVRTEVSLLKVVAATAVTNAVDRAVQVWGAAGVAADFPLERMLRRSRFTRIIDGPDELHRSVAARRILSRYPGAVPWSETASLMGAAAGSLDG